MQRHRQQPTSSRDPEHGSRIGTGSLAAALALLLATAGSLAAGPPLPESALDPATGNIDGRAALAVYPVERDARGRLLYPDPSAFDIRLRPLRRAEREQVHAGGAWFLPPTAGRYRGLLEGPWRISPHGLLVAFDDRPFAGRGRIETHPVVAAGRVRLSADSLDRLAPGSRERGERELRLLRATAHIEGNAAREELSRRQPLPSESPTGPRTSATGTQMPAGPVVALVWDRRARRIEALGRPFEVPAEDTVEIELAPPTASAHLFAKLHRPSRARTADDYDVRPHLFLAGRSLEPDLLVPTARSLVAVWYDLPSGPATLHADSGAWALPPTPIAIESGAVASIDTTLIEKPGLDVLIELPPGLPAEPPRIPGAPTTRGAETLPTGLIELAVRQLPDGEPIRRVRLPGHTVQHRFDGLPPARLEVELRTTVGTFGAEADLRPGHDETLVLAPELIYLSGTVSHGDDALATTLRFRTVRRQTLEAEADLLGFYELVSLEPLRSVTIELPDDAPAPFFDFFPQAIAETTVKDFQLPSLEIEVLVYDRSTGNPLAGVSVLARNNFIEPGPGSENRNAGSGNGSNGAKDEDGGLEKATNQQVLTDDTGLARLPPLRAGELELRASAEGYRPMEEPLRIELSESDDSRTVDLALEPAGTTRRVLVRKADGGPADGAELLLVGDLESGHQLFGTKADSRGLADVASKLAPGFLLIRHPSAGFTILPWPDPADGAAEGAGDRQPLHLTLPPLSPQSLRIRVRDPISEEAVAGAGVALWVGGHRLGGNVLSWLTGSRSITDRAGLWSSGPLPSAELAVLAWPAHRWQAALGGGLDARATPITFPWSETVEIDVAD